MLKGPQSVVASLFVMALGGGQTSADAIVPQALAIQPRLLAAIAALIVTGLLLLLYVHRRRLYIVYWMAGWMIAAAANFLAAFTYPTVLLGVLFVRTLSVSRHHQRARLRAERRGLPHNAAAAAGLRVRAGADPALVRAGTVDAAGPPAAFATGHVLAAGGLAVAGLAYLALARQTGMLGAAVVGAMLVAGASANIWISLVARQPDSPAVTHLALLSLAFSLVMALGMQLMTFEDMTYELRATNRRLESTQWELRQLVTTDALTGCRNRRFFDQIINREIQRHRRYRIPLSMVFVDVDRFKSINDTLGHEAGDRVLQQVADFLARNVREADYVFRWGGDEFLILISCTEEEAMTKGRDLQEAFAATESQSLPAGVGLSVGCAEVPADASDVIALVKVADDRMYENKRALRAG